jgi:hypothetical protein
MMKLPSPRVPDAVAERMHNVLPQKDKYPQAVFVDPSHLSHLVFAFRDAVLVDTESIDPNDSLSG